MVILVFLQMPLSFHFRHLVIGAHFLAFIAFMMASPPVYDISCIISLLIFRLLIVDTCRFSAIHAV